MIQNTLVKNIPSDYTYFDGGNVDNTIYNTNGRSKPLSGVKTDCVSCHHSTTVGGDFNFRNPNVQDYQIWGAGSENYGISKRGGNYKSIEASLWGILG